MPPPRVESWLLLWHAPRLSARLHVIAAIHIIALLLWRLLLWLCLLWRIAASILLKVGHHLCLSLLQPIGERFITEDGRA